ncbi:hypothetical protein BUALT_Bualt02G0119200 [Buddleja alternifolia]|uniref:Jacalin-type lectin domain-containing protein n=1 Tax=Buddleja alternifolia TaxID=168488 RepID=A0AAV6YA70_9LAMI|nr:hypothetical protein BUALT_Bualt02G0119200 [Buddleja alternifolia]
MVHMGCQNDQNTIVVGLLGGPGGSKWDDGSYDGVKEITLKYGSCIDSIQVVYENNSKPVYGEKHGGSGGANTAQIKLQSPEEFLTTVSGHYSPMRSGNPLVRSLTFKTNWRTFGPFGVEEGTPFSLEGGRIVGLKGSSGRLLDAIGFYIAPLRKM